MKKITRSNYYKKIFFDNKLEITKLFSILEDEESKKVLDCILKSYSTKWHNPVYYYQKALSEECSVHHFFTDEGYEVKGVGNPYFLKDIFDFNKCKILLDGGAYIGDTIEQAIHFLPNLKRVYAFEPNKDTYLKLTKNKNIKMVDVRFFNKGLGSENCKANFKKNDAGSRVDKEGSEEIDIISAGEFISELNRDEYPDFIKLDIEGAEVEVVNSLNMYIVRYKPDLAISIYHNLQDLWIIPLLLKSFCPEYRIYIRQQSNYFTETICFATITER